MNESGFIQSVHLKLDKSIYRWKISDRYSSGVADAYYSSPLGDLWIEYKFYPKGLPNRIKPKLSKLQLRWLYNRYKEGRDVYVIVGSPDACIIYEHLSWTSYKHTETDSISRPELVKWIQGKLCTN
jgi:hypothetical protein